MPRRRPPTAAEFLDDTIEGAVDLLVDRAAGAFEKFRKNAAKQQKAKLPPEYVSGIFQCAGCKREFAINDMEQVHPSNGWGTCRGCYKWMFNAGVEKAKRFSKKAAKAGARRAAPSGTSAGFQPPPPPAGPPPWEVLGVKQDADVAVVKQAYRKLAMTYHPDRVAPGAPAHERERAQQMFHAVQRAYDVMMKVRSAPTE